MNILKRLLQVILFIIWMLLCMSFTWILFLPVWILTGDSIDKQLEWWHKWLDKIEDL